MYDSLNPGEPVPLYYQLELLLRKKIEEGVLTAGETLPGEHELAKDYDVSRITVRRALDRLEEDGLIIRRQGRSTTVSDKIPTPSAQQTNKPDFRGFEDELRRLEMQPKAKVLEATVGAPTHSVADLLGIPLNESIVRIRRLGYADEEPLWIEARYFPKDIGLPLLEIDPASDSLLNLLEREVGLRIESVEATIKAVIATRRQATLLKVDDCAPLLMHQSITKAEGGRKVQLLQAFLRADYYQLMLQAIPSTHPVNGRISLVITGGGYLVGGTP